MSIEEKTESNEREIFYGEKLGKMIRCETISSSFDQDLSKFYRFHEVLEQLFQIYTKPAKSMNLMAAFCSNGMEKEMENPFFL